MTEHIEHAHWETFLNDFAKKHQGFDARIEIIGRDIGDQDMAAWLPLAGISYDPHHHQIFVTVGGISSHYPVHLTHTIDSPHTTTSSSMVGLPRSGRPPMRHLHQSKMS